MSGFIPITKYQWGIIKKYTIIGSISIIAILLIGNIAAALYRDNIKINPDQYTLKEGFPIFKNGPEYINFIKNYPYNPGTKIKIHKVTESESFWDITQKHNITIDTLLAANPFIKDLFAKKGIELAIPHNNGVLFAFDDFIDVRRMAKKLKFKGKISGNYHPSIFKIISTDDIRLVFFKGVKPEILNNSIEKLYALRRVFQSPLKGYFTSLFGQRVDPFLHNVRFHDGIDIQAKFGTPIKPARDGMVVFSGWRDGYGNTITVQHNDGYTTIYGHCSKIRAKQGEWVTKETTIGSVGSTGRSTGNHLHFVLMRHGEILNPLMVIW